MKTYISISYRDKKTGLFFQQATIYQGNKKVICKIGAKKRYFDTSEQAIQYLETKKNLNHENK